MSDIITNKSAKTTTLEPLIQAIVQLSWQEQLMLVQIILQFLSRHWSGNQITPLPEGNGTPTDVPGWGVGKDWWSDEEFDQFQQHLQESRGRD
ncbi:hypothetical protein QUF64_03070 [Anaerolineales bacterium HSG6]|nr:hypothetical protein [Anaerolineales bacterium HSG6]